MKNKKSLRLYSVIRAIFAWLMKLIFRIKVVNPEKEPLDHGGMIVCCNHISNADVIILIAAMKNQVHFLAKKELFSVPLLGPFIRALGAFPISRGSADVGAIKKTIELIGEGRSVGFFPQGTRLPGDIPDMSSVKNGIGMVTARSDADILPVALVTRSFRIKPFHRTKLVIGDVIKHSDICPESGAVTDAVTGRRVYTNAEYKRISEEIFSEVIKLSDENRI